MSKTKKLNHDKSELKTKLALTKRLMEHMRRSSRKNQETHMAIVKALCSEIETYKTALEQILLEARPMGVDWGNSTITNICNIALGKQ